MHVCSSLGLGTLLVNASLFHDARNIRVLIIPTIIELYAFSAHFYNRILAREALNNIPKEDVASGEDNDGHYANLNFYNEDELLKIFLY